MPKAKPQAKPSVGKAKAEASQAKRRDASANIVDKLDAEASASSTSAAKKRKRSLEEEVSKCLKDNFRGWSDAMTDLTLRGGVSLREKITADKLKIKSGDRVDAMGKYYYQSLRDEFGGHDVALRLQVRDPTQEENQLLVVGLKGVLQHARDFSPMNAFLLTYDKIDQKNLVALLKCTLRVAPTSSTESLNFNLNVMSYLARHSFDTSHSKECGVMRDHFDSALAKSLNTWRCNERPVSEWWSSSKAFAKLVLDVDVVDKILEKDVKLADILDDLAAVVTSSNTGSKMFSRAYNEAQLALVDTRMHQIVDELLCEDVTAERLAENKLQFVGAVNSFGRPISETFKPKEKQFVYLGLEFSIPVASIIEEYELKVASEIRTAAVDEGSLRTLWCEMELGEEGRTNKQIKVEPALVAASARARAACLDFLDGKDVTCDNVKSLFASKGAFLRQVDRQFQVEMHFWMACMGDRGNDRIKDNILNVLPAEKRLRSPREAMVLLKNIEDSKLFLFAGLGTQSIFNSIKSMVTSIASEKAPKFDSATDTDFFARVKKALLLFLVSTPAEPSASTSVVQNLRGKEALDSMYKLVLDDKASTKAVGLGRLRPLQCFAWALSEPQRALLSDWVKVAVNAGTSAGPAADAAAKRQTKKQVSKQSADSIVASLFT